MIQRRHLLQWITLGSSMTNPNATHAAAAQTWIVDDGEMELTPEYTVQYVQGQSFMDVYAAFTSIANKASVRLRSNSGLAVNGNVLQGQEHARGYYYRGRVPASPETLAFVLNRPPHIAMRHDLVLPPLGVAELPTQYRRYETLRVPVRYEAPPQYVSERFDLSINASPLRFDLVSTTRRKDNRHQFDRLPDIQDGSIVFRPITEMALSPGIHPAELYRQHRIVFSQMSSASRTGWATLSNTVQFMIEVK